MSIHIRDFSARCLYWAGGIIRPRDVLGGVDHGSAHPAVHFPEDLRFTPDSSGGRSTEQREITVMIFSSQGPSA